MTKVSFLPSVPAAVPQHIAEIMDGNRRWARQRGLPKAWVTPSVLSACSAFVEACAQRGVKWLTLFALSTENWKRPKEEVTGLMVFFLICLQKEARDMQKAGVRLKIIGDLTAFDARLNSLTKNVEAMTAHNTKITLTIAANYGVRWDMLQAVRAWHAANHNQPAGPQKESDNSSYLCLAGAPDPDLLVRTGGESRTSNFMLWQAAYTELFFTPTLWPDFNTESLDQALAWYAQRDRRFGGADAEGFSKQFATG